MPQKHNVEPTSETLARILSKAKAITAPPKTSIWDKILNIATGYPLPGEKGSLLDVGLAGLPFAAIRKGAKPIYHGTRSVFEKFDPAKYETSDILGRMTHFAEDPGTAADYAMGMYKPSLTRSRPNIIPAIPEARNVLDLTDPKGEDISTVLGALDPNTRRELIQEFRRAYSQQGRETSPFHAITKNLEYHLNKPGVFEKTPFDAIRYMDVGQSPSWAIPRGTPIRSAYNAPLTDVPTPIRIIKTDKPSGGELKITGSLSKPIEKGYSKADESVIVFDTIGGNPNPIKFKNVNEALDFMSKDKSKAWDYLSTDEYMKAGY